MRIIILVNLLVIMTLEELLKSEREVRFHLLVKMEMIYRGRARSQQESTGQERKIQSV